MKTILRIGSVTVVLLIVGLTIFFQLNDPAHLRADDQTPTWVIVEEQAYITETHVAQPVITHEEHGRNVFQYRRIQPATGN